MILPDAQHARLLSVILPKPGRRIVYSAEDGIFRVGNSNETVLIFQRPILALFVLLEPVQRNDPGAKAQTDKLVSTTNRKYRRAGRANKLGEGLNYRRVVVIKVTKRAAQNNRIRLKLPGRN